MSIHSSIDGALVLILLLDLAMLAAGRLATCIRIFAAQCLVLSLLPIAAEIAHGEGPGWHGFVLLAGTIGLKVMLIPWLLLRIIRTSEIQREIEPFIGFTSSVMIGALMIAGSFAIGARLPLPGRAMSDVLVPVAISTLLIGLLILISRTKAITQVLGYLVVENGVFLFGLALVQQMPILVELGILLDVFVGVFVMAIVVYHIRKTFDHMDTDELDQLREI
jgi:hydrogenase-4 component E